MLDSGSFLSRCKLAESTISLQEGFVSKLALVGFRTVDIHDSALRVWHDAHHRPTSGHPWLVGDKQKDEGEPRALPDVQRGLRGQLG